MLVSPATFLPSHENRGCCGEGKSQNLAEGEICTADNISACSFYFFFFFFFFAFYEYIYIFEAILE